MRSFELSAKLLRDKTPLLNNVVRHSFTSVAIFFVAIFSLAAACVYRADAATEFCPAQLVGVHPSSAPVDSLWQYHLNALGPRVVEGTIIADTDAGWFTWNQQAVELTRVTLTRFQRSYKAQYVIASSPTMSVRFPKSVAIRHAWIMSAKTHNDGKFNWDAAGTVKCEPPDFAAMDDREPFVVERTADANDPTPAPAPPTVTAAPFLGPFPSTNCPQPFVRATVTKAARPNYPISLIKDNAAGVSVVYVAVDSTGQLADTWVFKSSGYPAMDDEARLAAASSEYSAAMSYCRPVGSTYLFQAEFRPDH